MEGSLELARAAVAAGTRTILATPHINDDPRIDPARIAAGHRRAARGARRGRDPARGAAGRGDRDLAADRPRRRHAARAGARRRPLPARREPVLARGRRLRADGARPPRARPPRAARPPGALPGLPARPAAARGARRAPGRWCRSRRARWPAASARPCAASRWRCCARGSRTSSPPTPTTTCAARPACRRASRRSSATCRAVGAQAEWLTELVPRAVLDGGPLPARPPLPTRPAGLLRRLGLRA